MTISPLPTSSNASKTSLLPWATLGLAVSQFLAPYYPKLTGLGQGIEAVSAANPLPKPEQPADYAFAVWGVIFSAALIYAVVQVLPSQRDHILFLRTRLPAAILFALNTLWMMLAQTVGAGFHLSVLITALLVAALVGFFRTLAVQKGFDHGVSRLAHWATEPLFGMVSAWLTLATFLTFGLDIKPIVAGLYPDLSLVTYGAVALVGLTLPALVVLSKSQFNRWYGGVILWGLFAVMVKNYLTPTPLVLATSTGLWVVVLALLLLNPPKTKMAS
jgi:hypothetical protein